MLFQSCSLPDSLHLLLVYLSIYTFVLSSILLYVHSSSVLCTSAYISCFLYLPTYLLPPTYQLPTCISIYLAVRLCIPSLLWGMFFLSSSSPKPFITFPHSFLFRNQLKHLSLSRKAFNHSDVFWKSNFYFNHLVAKWSRICKKQNNLAILHTSVRWLSNIPRSMVH